MLQRRLFVTEAFSVLQDALLMAIRMVKTAQPLARLTILVPHASLGLHLNHTLAWAGQGHLGLQFLTLIDFARDYAETDLQQAGWRPLPPLAASFIISKLLRNTGPDNAFAPLAGQPKFPQAVLDTLTDCQQAGIAPRYLQIFLHQAGLTGADQHKLTSLAALYKQYRDTLAERCLYSEEDIIERAIELLESKSSFVSWAAETSLLVYGFYHFTPLERRLIQAAVHEDFSRDVLVFFPWRSGAAYEYATPTLNWLRSLGLQYTPLSSSASQRTSALSRVHSRLFEQEQFLDDDEADADSIVGSLDRSVRCLSAPSQSQEAREIGRVILQLVRDHGLRFDEIGIFLRESTTSGPMLVETLHGLGIPCFLAGGLPLLHTSAGQALRLLCQLLVEDFARPRVFEFLSVSATPFPALLGDLSEYAMRDCWEDLSRQAGIVKGRHEWRDRLSRLAAAYAAPTKTTDTTDDTPQKSNNQYALRALRVFMDGLFAASPQQSHQTWRSWAEYAIDLTRSYIGQSSETASLEAMLMQLAQLEVLGTQSEARNGETEQPVLIRLEDWTRTVINALTTTLVSPSQFDPAGVCIGAVQDLYGGQFQAVIVPDMVEGNFPSLVRQDPLLLDAERQHLAETLSRDLAQRSQQHEKERLLLCVTVHSAIQHLVFTYSAQNSAHRAGGAPSGYLLRILEAVRGGPQSVLDLDSWCHRAALTPGPPASPAQVRHPTSAQNAPIVLDTLEFHLATVEQAVTTGDLSLLGYLPSLTPAFVSALQAASQRWDAPQLTAFDGLLKDASAQAAVRQRLFPTGTVLSASALETYARCPFRYFLSTVLGLTPQDDPEHVLVLPPKQRGTLLHDILYDFFARLQAAGQLPLNTQDWSSLVAQLRRQANKHFADFAQTHPTGLSLLWEIEKEQLQERLLALLKEEYDRPTDFIPEAFEVQFGTETTDTTFFPSGPVNFPLPRGESIALRGRIDRIDLSPQLHARHKARIIDYKTGGSPQGRFSRGLTLQLPLYLFAAQTLRPDIFWESASYIGIHGPERPNGTDAPPGFSADTWPESLQTLSQIVTTLVEGMRAGCFFPQPDTCRPCPFPAICGSHVGKRMAAKQHDPHFASLRQLRTIA